MHPHFRTRLLRCERLIGTLLTLPVPELAEICADVGFDWLFLDAEHGSLGLAALQRIAQAVGERCPLVVRVPAIEEAWIKKVLDIGVAGIMIPQVQSAVDAAAAVRRARFPPRGARGIGVTRANRYGARLAEYLAEADAHTAVIVQVENVDAVRNVEQIMDTDGVDAVLVGPYDLSTSMGLPGRVTEPQVQRAIARVRQACLDRGFPLGIFAGDAEAAGQALADGFNLVAVSTDVTLFAEAASRVLARVRSAPA